MIEALLALTAVVNRVTEMLKATVVTPLDLPENQNRAVLIALSSALGIFAAFGAQLNVFADNPTYAAVPATLGMFITGVLIGAGSNAVHAVTDLLYGWRTTIEIVDAVDGGDDEPPLPSARYLHEIKNPPPADPTLN